MKKTIIYAFAVLLAGLATSCDSYLDIVPDKTQELELLFERKDAAYKALATCYQYLPQDDGEGGHARRNDADLAGRASLPTPYSARLRRVAEAAALRQGIPLKRGIYCVNLGPVYETPAEVRLARLAGADAVGMSTVPEALEAARRGVETLAISCITNSHVHGGGETTHGEVIVTARKVEERFVRLVTAIVGSL